MVGSLSHLMNAKASGYHELPDFPEDPPDPSVRNVEVCNIVYSMSINPEWFGGHGEVIKVVWGAWRGNKEWFGGHGEVIKSGLGGMKR